MTGGRSGARGPGDDADWPIDASAEDEPVAGTNTDNRMLSAAARLRIAAAAQSQAAAAAGFPYNQQAAQAQAYQHAQARRPNAAMVAAMSAWHEASALQQHAQYQDMALQARYRQQYLASMQQQAAATAAGPDVLDETGEEEVVEEAGIDPGAAGYPYGAYNALGGTPGARRHNMPYGTNQLAAVGYAKKTALMARQRALMAARGGGAGAGAAAAGIGAMRGEGATDQDAIAIDSSDDEEAPTVPPPKNNSDLALPTILPAEAKLKASESVITADERSSTKTQSSLSRASSTSKNVTHTQGAVLKNVPTTLNALSPKGNSSTTSSTSAKKGKASSKTATTITSTKKTASTKKNASATESKKTKRIHSAMAGGKSQSASRSTTKSAGSSTRTKKSTKSKITSPTITPTLQDRKSGSRDDGTSHSGLPTSPQQKKRKTQIQLDKAKSNNDQVVVDNTTKATEPIPADEITTLAGPFVQGYLRSMYPQNDRDMLVHEVSSKLIYFAMQKDNPDVTDVSKSIRISFDRVEKIAAQMIMDRQSAIQEAVRCAFRECQERHDKALLRATNGAPEKPIDESATSSKKTTREQTLEEELAKLKSEHSAEVASLKKKHAEEATSLKQQLKEGRRNQSRSLNAYMKASVESLRLLRKKNVYGSSNNNALGGAE